MADLRLLFLNCLKVCSKTCSKPTEICCLCYLEEIPEVLLKPDSVTDFKDIFQSTYQDTQLTLTETILLSFLSPTLNMVSFAEALSEVTTHKNNSTKTFAIFQVKIGQSSFVEKHLSTVFCRKNLKLFEERRHQWSYSSSPIHKSMFRYHNKDIKILVASLPTLKIFLSAEINSEVIEATTWNCFLKKILWKFLKNSQENTSAGVSFLGNRTKEEWKKL